MRIRLSPAGGTRHRRVSPACDDGATLVEVIVVLVLVTGLLATTVPLTASVIDDARARQAAGFAATKLRLARHHAVTRAAMTGLVFDRVGGRWTFRICVDGNRNGLRRADVTAGVDPCIDGPFDLEAMFGGAAVAVDPALQGPSGEPGSPDAVRFGASDLASFSPLGSSSSGSLLVRSPNGIQFMVRVAGVTGRTRLLRYDAHARVWRDG